ncbi:hypothetical protein [Streptomyces sannanensis]|uniref:hypothetical protein n=1 Tax=Streptomyces sannanensis TaxID=285536 RepID=UPI0031E6CCE3
MAPVHPAKISWRLDELDLPGKTMVSSERYIEPNEGRCYWITEQQIHETSLEHAPAADDGAAEDVRPHPEPDPDPEPPTPPSGGGGPHGSRPVLTVVPTFPDGSRIPENKLPSHIHRPVAVAVGRRRVGGGGP